MGWFRNPDWNLYGIQKYNQLTYFCPSLIFLLSVCVDRLLDHDPNEVRCGLMVRFLIQVLLRNFALTEREDISTQAAVTDIQ